MIKIHDIKNIVEINDYSFYFFLFLLLVLLVFLVFLFLYLYKLYLRKKNNPFKTYLKELKNVDLKNTKQASYSIAKYAKLLSSHKNNAQECKDILFLLEEYKYKKDVPSFSKDFLNKYNKFKKSLHV
ncbi:MAG: hypothetical protein COA66_08850 [Arcobacter sp.]|nr:MAG: hypothetical protein COA66_08850 [Arcobacter sp.]